ncbi:MAG: type II toxin-antitoxin system RelB/DinJ family antitoxin [Clostridiales Family XIII bacterium]|jgi:addiction module RelB/DinJ family antitoxin|nr:type II toxin-antitoxin system RelB/DinJ family antitoxin [Clostridiales Family XIII bacterium]
MAKTANVFARVEPDVKMQAEAVLFDLGITMSNAISLYLRQIALHRGLPFDVKLPRQAPPAIEALSASQFDAEIEKGLTDVKAGRTRKASDVHADMTKKYSL